MGFAKFLGDDPLRAIELVYQVERSKARAADELREFDALSVRFLNQLRGPYPAMDFEAWNEACMKMGSDYSPFAMTMPNFQEYAVRVVSGEASKNLNRSAIRLLQGEKPTLDLAADPESDAWLDSPWRDPFTEKPLHIQDDGDATLIYSLGPDQKDQGGAILYDPSNGTISDGDLAIRIPRR